MTFNIRVSTGMASATALPNAKLELEWKGPASPLGTVSRLIATGTSDENGFAHFSFKAKQGELDRGGYNIHSFENEEYFYSKETFAITQYDSVVNTPMHIPSKATLVIVCKNFSPVTEEDLFSCVPFFSNYSSNGFAIGLHASSGQPDYPYFTKSTGAFSSKQFTGTTAGNQYTYFNILTKKNGIRIDRMDSIFIAKGQTGTYVLEY